jgi:GTP cyclohydrolase I
VEKTPTLSKIFKKKDYDGVKLLNSRLDDIQELFYKNDDMDRTLFNELLSEVEMTLYEIKKIEDKLGIEPTPIRNMVSKTIDINSLCSHHFISFVSTDDKDSRCIISYIPKLGSDKALLGISKLQRIADYFGRRPQLQEELNWQIKTFLCLILRTQDVMISFHNIVHYCEKTRGVESHCGSTSSIEFGGRFEDPANRDLAFNITAV